MQPPQVTQTRIVETSSTNTMSGAPGMYTAPAVTGGCPSCGHAVAPAAVAPAATTSSGGGVKKLFQDITVATSNIRQKLSAATRPADRVIASEWQAAKQPPVCASCGHSAIAGTAVPEGGSTYAGGPAVGMGVPVGAPVAPMAATGSGMGAPVAGTLSSSDVYITTAK